MEVSKLERDMGERQRVHVCRTHLQPPLVAWFLGGHPAHLHESQAQAWELGPHLLQLESQLSKSTPA
jgi:hypothetical protein